MRLAATAALRLPVSGSERVRPALLSRVPRRRVRRGRILSAWTGSSSFATIAAAIIVAAALSAATPAAAAARSGRRMC